MIEYLIKRTLEALLAPPGINIFLILLGLFLIRRFYRSGVYTILLGFISLVVFSLPAFKVGLFSLLESYPPLTQAQLARPSAQAIVILGGGMVPRAPEYNYQDTINGLALERVRYGAYLHQQTGLPILVSGGKVFHDYSPEADLMQQALLRDFHIPVRWVERKSRNTMENAVFSQSLLHRDKIRRIYLVTQAWHMPRAVEAFRQVNLETIAAPTGFESTTQSLGYTDFLPSAHAMARTRLWIHEVLGRLWYQIRY